MKREQASLTAQRVAAQRALIARVPADRGDPAADDRLGRDVAADQTVNPQSPMFAYLAARTRFIDSVVVRSLQRGVTQVVIAGAGYDGRALRYGKPGVRRFELDHPATQADKLERLARLGLRADVLERLLRGLRARAAPESLLAISLSVGGASAERRERFQASVAAVGEPVRTVLTTDGAGALLAATGWLDARDPKGDAGEHRAARAGFLLARPV